MKEEKGFRLNFDNDDDDSHLDKHHSYVDDDAGDNLLIFFQRILEGRRACLSTGGTETTCAKDSKSCQFTVILIFDLQ